jgi:glutaredoxin
MPTVTCPYCDHTPRSLQEARTHLRQEHLRDSPSIAEPEAVLDRMLDHVREASGLPAAGDR